MRWFRLLFGATAPAASATLVGFLAGHALGAAAAARYARRWRRPLRAYGLLELAAAAGMLLVPLALAAGERVTAAVYDALRDAPAQLTLLRFAIALAATLPAAACFGATLPVVGAALLPDARGLGSGGSALYAANTFGAAAGTALAAFLLPDWLGVRATYAVALAFSATAGTCALLLARRTAQPSDLANASVSSKRRLEQPAGGAKAPASAEGARSEPKASVARKAPSEVGKEGRALALLSGAGAFAGQVLLVQAFAQVLNGSAYAFGAVLLTVLLTLALGAAIVALVERRGLVAPRTALGLALAAAALGFTAFPALLAYATNGFAYLGSDRPWPGYLLVALAVTFATAGPPLLAASLVLPFVLALAGRAPGAAAPGSAGPRLGHLLAANTVGAIAGALAAPFLLLPSLGLWPAFLALGALYALPAIVLGDVTPGRRVTRDALLATGWMLVLFAASPLALPAARLEHGETLLSAESSAAGVVAVVQRGADRVIRTDNFSVLGGTSETVHQERQGHLALLLAPWARRVAYVGSATGISAGAVLEHPVESLTLVEIVPGVADAARRHFATWNHGVYDAPRTHVVLDDARNFFRSSGERFDLVIADLFVPWRTGTGSLYTREHFEAIRAHLEPDGVFCQWLPLYQLGEPELETILATFLDVFPRAALFRGDFYGGFPIVALVGYTGRAPSADEVARAAQALAAAGGTDRWVTDPLGPFALYVGPLGPFAAELGSVPRNTDDRPRIEFLAARTHAGGTRGKERPITGLAWSRFDERVRAAALRGGDDVFPDLAPERRRAAEGGAALQGAGALWVAGRSGEAARALGAASELLPARLVGAAPADPTAAEVWRD